MATLNGAQLLVRSLLAGGVSETFSFSENQVLPIYDACRDPGGAWSTCECSRPGRGGWLREPLDSQR
jgi:hypothetical protein